jgi:hypothetical protein
LPAGTARLRAVNRKIAHAGDAAMALLPETRLPVSSARNRVQRDRAQETSMLRPAFTALLVVPIITASAIPAAAESIADFYRGRTIQMVIGVSAGGDYDLRARLLARYMSGHIPGNPKILPQNMLGGGGLVAANWLANVAPRDGTVMLAISSNLPGRPGGWARRRQIRRPQV